MMAALLRLLVGGTALTVALEADAANRKNASVNSPAQQKALSER